MKEQFLCIKKKTNIKKLYISANGITHVGVKEITKLLMKNTILEELFLSGNRIGDAGASELSAIFANNSTLTSLEMNHILDIGKAQGQNLCNAIVESKTLIFFSGIPVRDIKNQEPSLKKLSMSGKGCGDTGAFVLGELLKNQTVLKQIHLACNNIGDNGAEALVRGLKENETLTELDLFGNEITDRGVKRFSDLLKTTTVLEQLNLRKNRISKEQKNVLGDSKMDVASAYDDDPYLSTKKDD